jgi:ligand-binding sensor domain-containing protein
MQSNIKHLKNALILVICAGTILSCKKQDDNNDDTTAKQFTLEIADINIQKLHIDPNGTLWIASDSGLISNAGSGFKYYRSEDFIGTESLNDLAYQYSSRSGDELWVSSNNGLHVFTYDVDAVTSATTYNEEDQVLTSTNVKAISVDHENIRWIGTEKGINTYAGSEWKYADDSSEYNGYDITDVSSDQYGWTFVSTNGRGVLSYRYDMDVITGPTFVADWTPLETNTINAVFIDNDSTRWYCTQQGAVRHKGYERQELLDWFVLNEESGLASNNVLCMQQLNAGAYYIGTDEGLSYFEGDSIANINIQLEGLPVKVQSMALSENGVLWIGTEQGLLSYE